MYKKNDKDYINTAQGVLSTDLYNAQIQHIYDLNDAETPIYFNPIVVVVLTLILIASDAITLFSAFEKVLIKDSAPLLYSVVIISAAALELLPILISIILRKMELAKKKNKGKKPIHLTMCIAFMLAFVCVFALSANVRWATQDLIVNIKDEQSISSTTSDSNQQSAQITVDLNADTGVQRKHVNAVTLMLMILPFLTSCISFGLSYFSYDPLHNIEMQKTIHRVKLMAQKARYHTAYQTLKSTNYTGTELDDFQKAANANTEALGAVAKSIANETLAEKIATSEALDKCCK